MAVAPDLLVVSFANQPFHAGDSQVVIINDLCEDAMNCLIDLAALVMAQSFNETCKLSTTPSGYVRLVRATNRIGKSVKLNQ